MSEGTHSTVQKATGSKRTITIVVAGTAVALLAAGVFFQIFRAEEGSAGESQNANGSSSPGVASLKPGPRRGPLARVNRELIQYDTVADECFTRYGQEVLENVISRKIIEQECKKRNVVVTAEEVEREILKISKKFDLDPQSWFQMLQIERKITPTQYRRDVIWPMLALRKLAGDDIKLTEEDLKKAFIREYGPRVKAKMIMTNNFHRAQEVWNKVNETPEDFGRLAQKYSIDSTSKSLRGDIPPIRRYAGHENLEKEAFNLRQNEISGIIDVSTPGMKRFVILQCLGRTEPVVTDMEQVREQLMEQLEEEKVQLSVAKVFEKLKNDARVDNYLTQTSTGGIQKAAAKNPQRQVRTANGRSPVKRTSPATQ